MKKPMLVSIICLTLSVAACGKKGNDQVVNGVAQPSSTPASAPIDQIYPVPPGYNTNMSLQQYCQLNYGQMVGSICNITQNVSGQWNISWGDYYPRDPRTGSYLSIYSGQRVTEYSSGNPRVLVGGTQVATGSATFVANTNGYLGFQKYSFSTYSVQSIQVTTCADAPGHAVACL